MSREFLYELAASIDARVAANEGAAQFDISIILEILEALLPILEDCFKDVPPDAKAAKVCAMCEKPGRGRRFNGYRIARSVAIRKTRRTLGPDEDPSFVRDVADAVLDVSRENQDLLKSIFSD